MRWGQAMSTFTSPPMQAASWGPIPAQDLLP